jgi:hypothetical protein
VAGLIGTVLILAAAAAVVVFVVVPLLELPRQGAGGDPSPSSPAAPPSIARDVIPDTVGLAAAEAIAIANQAGLNWVLECDQDAELPEGIIDQEPPAGTQVAPGSRFTMFSARIADCRGGDDGGNGNGNGNGNGQGGGD